MSSKKWYQKAVEEKPPYSLGGWSKDKPARIRRKLAVDSRPTNWSRKNKYLSAGRALLALSNITQDSNTKRKARQDAEYFFRKLKK